jgi:1,4-alpha-glucan branching enzyme
MGGEFAQQREWDHDVPLDWDLLDHDAHRGVQALVRDLNRLYVSHPALHTLDCERDGFEWIEADDADHSRLAFLRIGADRSRMLVVCNFTPVPRHDFRVGVPDATAWREVLNTDSAYYGGSNIGNGDRVRHAEPVAAHRRAQSITVTLPPLATVVFAPA